MGAMFKKSLLLVLVIIFLATIVSGCPWDDTDDPSPVTPLDKKATPDPDDDDPTSKPKITPKPYEPKNA